MNLHEYFYYDETSPSCIRWNQTRYTGNPQRVLVAKGDSASSLNRGYYATSVDGHRFMTHRVIWELFHGEIPEGFMIDHIDGNGLNNKLCNLRIVTSTQNARNSSKRSHNKTGYTGVAKTCRVAENKEYWYYTALWKTLDGKQKTANYSIDKLGDSTAFLLALSHRQHEMEMLHYAGAGYSHRHGK
jgi:hypothetical protein